MPSRSASTITLSKLPVKKFAALRKIAGRLGITPEAYVKSLIDDAIQMDHLVRHSSFSELAAPFEMALAGVSEKELDAFSRPPRRKSKR